ncbi:MAG: Fic family protein [Desulfuromusa sp.]|nr:Fic family protein [Desulfuromusa sp.]
MTQANIYFWQQPTWPQFRWDSAVLMKPLGLCRFQQGSLLAQMRELGLDVRQQARAEVLIEEVLKTSEIEGERLDPNAVRSSVARRLGLPTAGLVDVKNQHADGVVEILLDATLNYGKGLTSERLFGWHAALFPTGYSSFHKIRVAAWRDDRDGPMRVVSGSIGREKIHYEALPAAHLESEMNRYLAWWEKSRQDEDGLLRAAVSHLWFVSIHPFEDGNGRIARTLTEMALAQDEALATRYYSLSAQIMADRESYYSILERAQKGDGDISEWILWFLDCMSKAILSSNGLLTNVMQKARFWQNHIQTELSERQRKVINRLLNVGSNGFEGGMTNRKYAGIAHISRATAQRELSDLVEKGIFRTNPGGGRSVSYSLCWEEI